MDHPTLEYYEANAEDSVALYESVPSALLSYVKRFTPPGAAVLDIGAGSGRDLAALLDHGFDAYGMEPSVAMRDHAIRCHPEIAGRLLDGGFPDLSCAVTFAGIASWGSLMHVAEDQLPRVMLSLAALLTPYGHLFISVPASRPGLDTTFRESTGRLYTPMDSGTLTRLARHAGFYVVEQHQQADSLGRHDHAWLTMVFRCSG